MYQLPTPSDTLVPYMVGLARRLNQLILDGDGALLAIGAHSGRFQWTTWPTPTTSTTATYLNRGNIDVWVQKMRPDGRTQWVTVFGGSGRDDGRMLALHIDTDDGDVAVAGAFQYSSTYTNPMKIGRFTLNAATSPAGTATNDVFVARLGGVDGSVRWARQFGGAGADEAVSVGVTSTGATVVAGTFTSPSLALDGVTLTNPDPSGSPVVFVAHLDARGVVTSASAYPELLGLSRMVVDPATDAVYLIGTDYVARLGRWTTSLAGISGADRRRGLAVDPSSRFVFIGAHYNRGSLKLGNTTLANAGGGLMDGVVARLDAETGAIDWAVRVAGEDDDRVLALAVDADSLYVSGA